MSKPPIERPAAPSDHELFARFFVELATGDPIPSPEVWRNDIVPGAFFLEDDGVLVAYGWGTVMTDTGYVRHVVVAPEHRGKGLGRALMDIFVRRFRAAGCARICLNVKPDNTPAIRLYESFGLRQAYASTALALRWEALEKLDRDPEAVVARAIEPAEDAALERAFGLPGGQLAEARARLGWVLVRLEREADPSDVRVALACFNPGFPGSFPFRVARPSLARPLLEALRPHARPEHDFTRLMIEGDPPLTAALIGAGAEVKLEILHLEGPMPA